MDILPIPPALTGAVRVRFFAKPTIPSTNSSCAQQALGAGGGESPGMLGASIGDWAH